MIKPIFSVLLIVAFTFARENPFIPKIDMNNLPITNNSPDFKPIFRKKEVKLPPKARVLKDVVITYQNIDGSVDKVRVDIDSAINWNESLIFMQNVKEELAPKDSKSKYKEVAKLNFIKIYVNNNSIKIFTKDAKIRDFILVKPHRIVIDFKKDTTFYTKSFKTKYFPFTSVTFGNHDKFYRAVIELEGIYTYKIKETKEGYLIEIQ